MTEATETSEDIGTVVERSIVVGIDGSSGSEHALAWAVANAPGPRSIQPVACWNYPWWAISPPMAGNPGPPPDDWFREEAKKSIRNSLAEHDAELFVDPIIGKGRAGPMLVSLAEPASVLVVGSRGHGALVSSLLGSVSSYCIAHSTVPVVVVPDDADASRPVGRVVVGVDGSENSIAALAWAMSHVPIDTPIDVIHAWSPPAVDYDFGGLMAQMESGADSILASVVASARERSSHGDRPLTTTAVFGDARSVLRDAPSDLLVIGTRGHRGITHLLLGSIASALTHHPAVATIVVPEGN